MQYTENLIPKMTSNNSPEGVVKGTNTWNSNTQYSCFDRDNVTVFHVADTLKRVFPVWVSYTFTAPKKIAKYTITSREDVLLASQSPKSWTFEGSNDEINWNILHQVESPEAWGASEKKTFVFDNNNSYSIYRLNITDNLGHNYTSFAELEMMESLYYVKYLIKSNSKLYNLDELGEWSDTLLSAPVSSDFQLYGMDDLSLITEEQWSQLQKPIEVLTWTNNIEATSVDISYEQKEFANPRLELTIPAYKPIDLFDEPEIVTLVEGDTVPKLHIEGFRDLRPFMESANPKLLISTDQEVNPTVQTNSIPNAQLVLSKDNIFLRMLDKVQSFTLTSTESLNGIVRLIFSVDDGATWQVYDSVSATFKPIDISNLDNIKNNGMTAEVFNSIGTRWNDVVTGSQIKFGYYLEMEDENSLSEVDKLEVVMDVTASWDATLHETDYNYEYDNEKIYVELYKDGSYKVSYMQ